MSTVNINNKNINSLNVDADSKSLLFRGLGVTDYIHGSDPLAECDRLEAQFNFVKKIVWQDDHGLANIVINNNNKNKNNSNESNSTSNKNFSSSTASIGRFLEVGCGVGAQTESLLHFLPSDVNVISIDIDELKVARARELYAVNSRVSFHVMDASDLSRFGDGEFEGAYVCWVFEHLIESKSIKLLQELKRIVKSNGIILINEAIMSSINESLTSLPITSHYNDLYLQQQRLDRGNGDFGEFRNIDSILTRVGFYSFKYQKMNFHNLSDHKHQQEFVDFTIQNYNSVLPLFIKLGLFSEQEFDEMKQELRNNANKLKTYFGKVKIINKLD